MTGYSHLIFAARVSQTAQNLFYLVLPWANGLCRTLVKGTTCFEGFCCFGSVHLLWAAKNTLVLRPYKGSEREPVQAWSTRRLSLTLEFHPELSDLMGHTFGHVWHARFMAFSQESTDLSEDWSIVCTTPVAKSCFSWSLGFRFPFCGED